MLREALGVLGAFKAMRVPDPWFFVHPKGPKDPIIRYSV